jgi:hypothetical protein
MIGQATFENIMSYVKFVYWVYKTHPEILAQYYREVLKNASVQKEDNATNEL